MQHYAQTKVTMFGIKCFIKTVVILDTLQNTIQGTVDQTRNVAQSAVDTGKTYVNTAKGKLKLNHASLSFDIII